ncbi:extracellular solute-binding protein [Cohnella rhizosphaerae]|uniref:Extracellular solute-binding protein n=1 Tax=Cohnella rhizosphaerae TaxID=1457232 RepID=A0A9X4QTR0_9BACL|nr:extracellular solute-binding protein [Cohnella rhizosphaerae]MDG0810689.1 extracellular solute-binding protein [Cohnella rhizosphaerae]
MNNRPYRLLLSICLILALFALSACGGNNGNKGGDASPSAAAPASSKASPASAKQVKLTFWHHYSASSPEEKTLTETLIPKFEQENPGIKVEAVAFTWEDLHKKLQIAGSTNELPDIARLDIIWVPELQRSNWLLPLDEKFPDFKQTVDGLLEGPVSTAKVGEHYYGIPLNTNTKVLFWNEAMLKQAGLSEPPATTDAFFAALEAVKSSAPKAWGYGEPGLYGWNVLPWIWSNGGDVLAPDMSTADGYLNSADTVAILTRLQQAYQDGMIAGFKPGDVPVTEGHAKGSYALIAEGPWAVAQFQGQFAGFNARMTGFPAGKTGSVQVLGGEDIGILNDRHEAESWKFLQFMTGEFAQVEMGKVGQIPVNLAAMDNAEIKAIDYFAPFLEQLSTAKARPPVAAWPQIDEVINTTMSKIFLKKTDVKTELDQAVKQIDDLLGA